MFKNKTYLPYLLILLAILAVVYFLINSSFTQMSSNNVQREGYISSNWSVKMIEDFLNFQKTKNPNLIFDVDIIQKQATQDEVNTLLKTGKWPWDEETKTLYTDALKANTILKTSPKEAMDKAMEIYNQKIIREMISWSSPEGQFLLRGAYAVDMGSDKPQDNGTGTYGVNSGLVTKTNDLIRCGMGPNNKVSLQQIQNMGTNPITGAEKKKTTALDFTKLPTLLPGFRFINAPCDPCAALDSPPKYTCAFSLTDKVPSPIWTSLWGIKNQPLAPAAVAPPSAAPKPPSPPLPGPAPPAPSPPKPPVVSVPAPAALPGPPPAPAPGPSAAAAGAPVPGAAPKPPPPSGPAPVPPSNNPLNQGLFPLLVELKKELDSFPITGVTTAGGAPVLASLLAKK
jgi:hypothetical protein